MFDGILSTIFFFLEDFLSSSPSFLLAISIRNKYLPGKEEMFKTSFTLFFIETLQNLDWKIRVRRKDLLVSNIEWLRWARFFSLCSESWKMLMFDVFLLLSRWISRSGRTQKAVDCSWRQPGR